MLASCSLLSIGQLCDHGCTASFTKHVLCIFYKGKIIMRGSRTNKRWTIDTDSPHGHSLNATIGSPTLVKRIKFYHASLLSLTLATLGEAIDSWYLTTFPGFTTKQLNKYPPSLAATHKGHLNAQRKNLQSTQAHSISNLESLIPATPIQLPNIIENDEELAKPPTLVPKPSLAPPALPPTQ